MIAHHRMMRGASQGRDPFEAHRKLFHMELLFNCGLPMLLKYRTRLYDLSIRYRYIAARNRAYKQRDLTREHDGILTAAIGRDASLVSERLLSHNRLTGAHLTGLFDGMTAA